MWKKLWKIILVIVVIVVAIYFPEILSMLGEWLTSAGFLTSGAMVAGLAASVPWWVGAVVGVGAAYLIDPKTTTEVIGDIGDVAADIGGAVGGVVADTVGGLLEKVWPMLLIGGAAWLFFGSDDNKRDGSPSINAKVE